MASPIKDDDPGSAENSGALDAVYMERCLELAAEAAAAEEVPVGAVLVLDGRIVGEGRNRTRESRSPLRHAEMIALEQAFESVPEARLPGAVLYCTLEPCFMCTGALLHARVGRIVFGAHDPKFGACGSLADLPKDARLNHRCPVDSGVLADRSAAMLREFFQARR